MLGDDSTPSNPLKPLPSTRGVERRLLGARKAPLTQIVVAGPGGGSDPIFERLMKFNKSSVGLPRRSMF